MTKISCGKQELVALILSATTLAACASTPPQEATISGSATYRERIALPPNAVFEAVLEDVSKADAPAEVIGVVRIESPGNPPIAFTIPYDALRIEAAHRYVVRARITVDDRLFFTSDTAHPVLAADNEKPLEILMRRASGDTSARTSTRSTAVLENTYWKLTELDGRAVEVAENQREPHFVLHPDQQRVAGSGGCNRFMGGYKMEGNTIEFTGMAGTMMACAQGMEQERAFLGSFEHVVRWRIGGERLDLLDEKGNTVARFESRYM